MDRSVRNHETILMESIKHFLTSYYNGNADFSSFETIFFRLIQTMLDPPFEITWFYSAVTFHAAKSSPQSNASLSRVVVAKDLLNLLISCSNLSRASKKIALLAPVVYELYNILHECDNDVCVRMELEKLVERVVGYASMCAGVQDFDFGKRAGDCDDGVPVCFEELVRVWTVDRGGGRSCAADDLSVFFPGMSGAMPTEMCSIYGIHELVGIVLCELFFLRMHSSVVSKARGDDGLEDLKNQASLSMKGFQNWYFLDMLLKVLSEPSLPIDNLLSPKDGVILRKTLYDAVILFDFSFYLGFQSFNSHFKRLAILWVLVVDRAIQFSWNIADQDRAVSYLNALRKSPLVAELVKWASCEEEALQQQKARPDIVTPQTLIKWIFVLESRGVRVFDSSSPIIRAKATTCLSNVDRALCLVNNATADADRSRKRKDGKGIDLEESRAKQAKLQSSIDGKPPPLNSNVGAHQVPTEVTVLTPDHDMEIIG